MSWESLLSSNDEEMIAPWVGGRTITFPNRVCKLQKIPNEFGWYKFKVKNRNAKYIDKIDKQFDLLKSISYGYLVGDRFIPDTAVKILKPQIQYLIDNFKQVYLIEEGLDRFVRISVGKFDENGPLIYNNMEMPLGPEDMVLNAFLDKKDSIDNISGVTPGLDIAFKIETWRRNEAERIRKEEEDRREAEERRQKLLKSVETGIGRREVAKVDFAAAARAALSISGSEYLDHRQSSNRNEMVVRFRLDSQKFECTCNKNTLSIIDAGVCLTNERTGEKGDTWLTLESLPPTIRQASREHRLVIFRHVY